MGVFGSKKSIKDLAAKSDIPEEIYREVRVMGDAPEKAFAEAAPAPSQNETQKQPSPFLPDALAPDAAPAAAPATPGPPQNLPLGDEGTVPLRVASTSEAELSHSSKWKYVIWAASGLLLLLLLGGVAYFMWLAPEPEASPIEMPEPQVQSTPETTPEPEEATPAPFSVTGANYLPINTETSTPDSIASEIAAQEEKLRASGIQEPVKFLITDQNNIPLAFSRFAFLMDLPLPTDLQSLFEESFALYLYNDGGVIRRALVASIDVEQARFIDEQLSRAEAELPEDFQKLFYAGEAFDTRNLQFATGNFNGNPVRYVNFDLDRNFSFDYLKTDTFLIFGNSKNMVRTVLSAENAAK